MSSNNNTTMAHQQAAFTNILYDKAYVNEFGTNPAKHAPLQWKHSVYIGKSDNTPPMSNYEMCARTNWGDQERRKNVGGKVKGIGNTKRILRSIYSLITLYGLIPTWLSFIEKTIRIACTIVIGASFAKLFNDYGSSVTSSTDPTRDLNQDIQFVVVVTFGVTLFYALIYGIPMLFRYCKGMKRRRNRDAFSKLIADILNLDSLANTYENEYDSDEDPHRAFTYYNDIDHLYVYFSSLTNDTDDESDLEEGNKKIIDTQTQVSNAITRLQKILPLDNKTKVEDKEIDKIITSTAISLNAWKVLIDSRDKQIEYKEKMSVFTFCIIRLLQAPLIKGCNADYYEEVGMKAFYQAKNPRKWRCICCSRDTISADGKSYSYLGSEKLRFD